MKVALSIRSRPRRVLKRAWLRPGRFAVNPARAPNPPAPRRAASSSPRRSGEAANRRGYRGRTPREAPAASSRPCPRSGARSAHDDKRAVALEAQAFALGAEGEAVELVRREEVVLVVEGDRPEAFDRRRLGEGALHARQPRAPLVEVLIEIAGLARPVDEDVRLRHRRARVIVGAELCAVDHRGPVVGQRRPADQSPATLNSDPIP